MKILIKKNKISRNNIIKLKDTHVDQVFDFYSIPSIPYIDGMINNNWWNTVSTDNTGSVIKIFFDGKLNQAGTYNTKTEAILKLSHQEPV